MTKICVLGATGLTGTAIVDEALSHGVSVLALVRNPEKMTQSHELLTVVKAEISDFGSAEVLQEITQCDHVVIALGSKRLRGDTIRSDGTKKMLDALKKGNHTPRVWCISSAGTGESLVQLGFMSKMIVYTLLNQVIKDHHVQEQAVLTSGFPYTILRPTGLTNEPATDNYILKSEGKLEKTQISRKTIARCLIANLDKDDLLNKAICMTSL